MSDSYEIMDYHERSELEDGGMQHRSPTKRGGLSTTTQSYDPTRDRRDMTRMGKQQQLKRNFRVLSITVFSTVAMSAWLFVFIGSGSILIDGGTGGFVVMFLVNATAVFFIALSLAEMASIAPTAGGQYHWTSEFASPGWQKPLSYVSGWLSSLAWLCGSAAGMYTAGALVQGLIVLCHPSYSPKSYQGFLLTVLFTLGAVSVNTFFARRLPTLEGYIALFYGIVLATLIVVLWVLAPKLTAEQVFTTFTNAGGWPSIGLSMLASQGNILFLITGFDATAHMAEETQNAGSVIPKAMISSYLINAVCVFICIITYLFALTDYQAAITSPTGYPFMQVFLTATNSVAAVVVMTSMMIALNFFGTVNYMAATSRQVFAFARDKGFPYGHVVSKVRAGDGYPQNAMNLCFVLIVALCIVSLGSDIAFNAIVSLQILALAVTYFISISCLVRRRLRGPTIPRHDWSLGRFGLPVNGIALVYCVYLFVFIPFPPAIPVSAANFNWAVVMFAIVMIFSLGYYLAFARKVYDGPVKEVVDQDDIVISNIAKA